MIRREEVGILKLELQNFKNFQTLKKTLASPFGRWKALRDSYEVVLMIIDAPTNARDARRGLLNFSLMFIASCTNSFLSLTHLLASCKGKVSSLNCWCGTLRLFGGSENICQHSNCPLVCSIAKVRWNWEERCRKIANCNAATAPVKRVKNLEKQSASKMSKRSFGKIYDLVRSSHFYIILDFGALQESTV